MSSSPALPGCGLDRDLDLGGSPDFLPLGRRKGAEELEAGHRNDARSENIALVQQLARLDRDRNFDPVANGETGIPFLGRCDLISAGSARLACSHIRAATAAGSGAVRASTLGPCEFCSASSQHSTVSTASARTEHVEVRDRAQRSEMLDRLMGRAILASPMKSYIIT